MRLYRGALVWGLRLLAILQLTLAASGVVVAVQSALAVSGHYASWLSLPISMAQGSIFYLAAALVCAAFAEIVAMLNSSDPVGNMQ